MGTCDSVVKYELHGDSIIKKAGHIQCYGASIACFVYSIALYLVCK